MDELIPLCVEEYGEWRHMILLGYSADMLRSALKNYSKIER